MTEEQKQHAYRQQLLDEVEAKIWEYLFVDTKLMDHPQAEEEAATIRVGIDAMLTTVETIARGTESLRKLL